ncbi:MAG: hypothetical protein OXG84_12850 [Chloroflexi bacterium]|nr:hypothetical protein [Chloroflexota bacterium]
MEANGALTQAILERTDSRDRAAGEEIEGTVSVEALAYIALALLALALRIGELDTVSFTDFEAEGALQAWHTIEDDAPGAFKASSSPLTHVSQLILFSLLGASEFSARLGAAMAGVALSLSPLLFRESLGRTRTFVWAALLALLTVPIVSSRTADGTVFMMLNTILAIWMIRRYWYSRRFSDASWAVAFLTCMFLLSSPSGILLLVVLMGAGWLAVWRTAISAPQRLDLPGDDILQLAVKRLRDFPIAGAAFAPVLLVVLTSTVFMLNPAGLSTVSELINRALAGITQSSNIDGTRLGFVAIFTYEPLLIIYALGGAWLLWKKGDITYIDRFAAAWAAIGALGLLLYPGARATDAMWVVVPLTMLASYGITQLMINRRVVLLWSRNDDDENDSALYAPRYRWVKWAISAGVLMFLLILSVQFMQVARLMLQLPTDTKFTELFPLLLEPSQTRLLQGIALLMITALVAFVVFLLTANFWGLGTCLQGVGLGFLWMMLLSGIGGAWNGSVTFAENRGDLWRQRAIAEDARLLRETLFELADRDTSGFPTLDVIIVIDAEGIIRDDGVVAWLMRDFPNARFVKKAEAAARAPIVLTAQNDELAMALDGDYVGQRFLLRRNWSLAQLNVRNLPAWWTLGRFEEESLKEERIALWLRQDVYDGIPIDQRPNY